MLKRSLPPWNDMYASQRRTLTPFLLFFLLIAVCSAAADGAEESSVQSRARPFGLDIVNTVNIAGSDARAADFQENALPDFKSMMNQNLGERQSLSNSSDYALDPSKLTLSTDSDVRVYFVGEGAGYHNTLGFSTSSGGTSNNDEQLIFPDASSRRSGVRTRSYPLQAGDFVDLGTIAEGSQLDFFLIANGARGGTNTWGANDADNADGYRHVVAFTQPNSPYLMIGFEDMYGGGDKDYNDVMFVVDLGVGNVQALVGAPEPTTWALLGLGAYTIRRSRRKRLLQQEKQDA